MSNFSGWNLTGRLLGKHFEAIGGTIATMIANFDPETATEADRDRLADELQGLGTKFSQAKAAFDKEHGDVITLRQQIASDENLALSLAAKLESKEIDEATATLFVDELEASKARLPQEVQEEADAKAYLDELQEILTEMSTRLSQFDAAAAKTRRELASAEAELQMQQVRREQQDEVRALRSGTGATNSAMAALQSRADKLRAQAAGMKVVTDIGQKPADDKAKLDALRRTVASGAAAPLSTLERLKALGTAAQAGATVAA